jgi:hypothetical protein
MSDECKRCEGCGKLATDDDESPWIHWANLPLQSAAAVLMGLVRPKPCHECGGTGKKREETRG